MGCKYLQSHVCVLYVALVIRASNKMILAALQLLAVLVVLSASLRLARNASLHFVRRPKYAYGILIKAKLRAFRLVI